MTNIAKNSKPEKIKTKRFEDWLKKFPIEENTWMYEAKRKFFLFKEERFARGQRRARRRLDNHFNVISKILEKRKKIELPAWTILQIKERYKAKNEKIKKEWGIEEC